MVSLFLYKLCQVLVEAVSGMDSSSCKGAKQIIVIMYRSSELIMSSQSHTQTSVQSSVSCILGTSL